MTGWHGDQQPSGWNPQNQPDPYQGGGYQPAPGQGGYQPGGYDQTQAYPGQGGYDQTQAYPGPGYDQTQAYPATGAFPAQDQGGYYPAGGGFGGPPPPKPSKTPAILGILAIVVIVATVVTLVLVNRSNPNEVAAPESSSEAPPPSSRSTTSRSAPPSRSTTAAPSTEPADGQTITNENAGLTYQVPESWKPSGADATAKVLEVTFAGIAEAAPYDCGGTGYTRGFAMSAAVQDPDKGKLDLEDTARAFTDAMAGTFYPKGAIGGEPAVRDGTVGGKTAIIFTATVETTPTNPDCEASKGEFQVLAIDLDNATDATPPGVALLVLCRDVEGGPADPAPVSAADLETVMSTVAIN
ncbi:hypothetical protein [Actinokineospora pegani]|uniref:hypothetical protein n=1 Tax=Actinokineospora pegani TaxID=2654637 RepID=UPI0012EA3ED0|nr:hypothetical protein [Actinokineospora pegani]